MAETATGIRGNTQRAATEGTSTRKSRYASLKKWKSVAIASATLALVIFAGYYFFGDSRESPSTTPICADLQHGWECAWAYPDDDPATAIDYRLSQQRGCLEWLPLNPDDKSRLRTGPEAFGKSKDKGHYRRGIYYFWSSDEHPVLFKYNISPCT